MSKGRVFSHDIRDDGKSSSGSSTLIRRNEATANNASVTVTSAAATSETPRKLECMSIFKKQFGLSAGLAVTRVLARRMEPETNKLKNQEHQNKNEPNFQEDSYHGTATILDVPDIPLENILAYADLPTILSLAKSNGLLHNMVKNLCISRKLHKRCLDELTEDWFKDERILHIISSFSADGCQRLCEPSTWDDILWIGKDLRNHIENTKMQVTSAREFESYVKNDIVAMFQPKDLDHPNFKPLNGSFGSDSWSILPDIRVKMANGIPVWRPFYVYQQMKACDRNYKIPESLGSVTQVIKLIYPNKDGSLSNENPYKVDRNLLLILEEGFVTAAVEPRNRFCTNGKFPSYDWTIAAERNVFKRAPFVAVTKNWFAVWSSPYIMNVYKVMNDVPRVCAAVAIDEKTEFKADGRPQKLFLGMQWQKYSAFNTAQGLGKPLFHVTDTATGFIFRLVHPMRNLAMWMLKKDRGEKTVQARELPLQHEGYHQDYCSLQSTPFGQWYPSHAGKLALFWSIEGFAISSDVIKWSWCKWSRILPVKDDSKVHFAKVIDSDLVVIGLQQMLYIATTDCIWDEKDTGLTLRIFRYIEIPAYSRDMMIKHVDLEFEDGRPYLWVKTEKKELTGNNWFEFYFNKIYFECP